MNNHDALIEKILELPGVELMGGQAGTARQGGALDLDLGKAADEDGRWDFHDSSFALRSGLQVTERQVPADLCRKLFPARLKFTSFR